MSGSVSAYGAEAEDEFDPTLRTPSRRGTYSKFDVDGSAASSGIPMPSSARRQSGGPPAAGRRSSAANKVLEDLGETY